MTPADIKESLAEATRIATIAEGAAVLLFLAMLTVWLAIGSGA